MDDPAIGNRALLAERLAYEIAAPRPARAGARGVRHRGRRRRGRRHGVASLRRALRAQDTVARVGGRALCVLAPETDRYAATHLSRRLRDALPAARVGVALFPHDARAPRALVARAAAAAHGDAAGRRAA